MRLPKFLLNLWINENRYLITANDYFDLIVPISYSTGREKLVIATEAIARRAADLAKMYPKAAVVVSNCEYTFPGAEEVEWKFKQKVFAGYDVKARRAGNMNNSVQEAQAIAKYIAEYNLNAARILIVTGEMHSRSARWIWQRAMPCSKIVVTCVSNELEWQKDHPVLVQRTAWKWFLANVARQILLQVFGLDRIGRLHHRSQENK